MINLDNLKHFVYHLGSGERPMTPQPTANSWRNYSYINDSEDYQWAPLTIWKDQFGFVHMRGLIEGGTYNSGTTGDVLALPTTHTPPSKVILPAFANGSAGDNNPSRFDIMSNGGLGSAGAIRASGSYSSSGSWVAPYGKWPTSIYGWKSLGDYYQNGTTDYTDQSTDSNNNWHGGMFWKDDFGFVHLAGLVKGFPDSTSTPAFTLPAGYRPSKHEIFTQIAGHGECQVRVYDDGRVTIEVDSNNTSWGSIAGISFMASDAKLENDWQDMVLLNSWVNHEGGYQDAQYLVTPDAVVHIRGMIKNGTTTSRTVLWDLPSHMYSHMDQIYPIETDNELGSVDFRAHDIGTNHGRLEVRRVSSEWLSLSGVEIKLDWFSNKNVGDNN